MLHSEREELKIVLESIRVLFSKIPRDRLDAEAMGAYGRARSILIEVTRSHGVQIRQPRKYSYKPEARVE